MRPRKATNKTATPTPPKKAAGGKATRKSTTKARKASQAPVENRLPEAEKLTPGDVPEVLEEISNGGEQEEKAVLKVEDAKPPVLVGEGLEDTNVPKGSEAEIPGGKVEDAAVAVAEVKAEEQSAGDLAEKTEENDEKEENQSAENLAETADHNADAKSAEEVKKDDARNEVEVPGANVVDEYSESQNAMSMSERPERKKLEVFVGGLDRDATEDDLRQVFEKVGEITELRLMKNFQTGKNKGYAFVRYATAAEAKRAVNELANEMIRGKKCGVVHHEENDTIFLGNIDKNWTKNDVLNKVKEVGVENIIDVTVIEDPQNTGNNRGFAFVKLESYKDAQIAFKTALQKRNAFGTERPIKVAWAQPLNDPDEDVMAQVKSVFVEGLLPRWNEEQVKERFGKFGEIERVVLASNMQSSKRKDFGFVNYTTRESALACIEAFSKDDELIDGDIKVKVKVSLAKPAQKGKIGKGPSKGTNKGDSKGPSKGVSQGHVPKHKSSSTSAGAVGGKGLLGRKVGLPTLPSATRPTLPSAAQPTLTSATQPTLLSVPQPTLPSGIRPTLSVAPQPTLPSAAHEILHILRQQAAWGQGAVGGGQGHVAVGGGQVGGHQQTFMVPHVQPMSSVQGYGHALPGEKRPYTALDDISVNSRGNPRARLESTIAAGGPSYGLPARGQGSLSNPMFAGASVEQFYHRPSVGATLGTPFGFQSAGGPYTTGSASYVPIGLQGPSAHGGHGGGASFRG